MEELLGIQNVHLISGEDFIGKTFMSADGERLIINKPVIPNMAFDQSTQKFQVSLMPLRPYLDNISDVEIERSHVIFNVNVGSKMEKLYQQFTSSIIIAEPKDIDTKSLILG